VTAGSAQGSEVVCGNEEGDAAKKGGVDGKEDTKTETKMERRK